MTTPHTPSPDECRPPPRSPWPYPRWIAHRGAGKLAPENTLLAARRGLEAGAHLWETDLGVTRDEELILLHDHSLARRMSRVVELVDGELRE